MRAPLLAIAVLAATAGAAEAQVYQCRGEATEGVAFVEVTIYVGADGRVQAREAVWGPGVTQGPESFDPAAPVAHMVYRPSEQGDLGPLDSVRVFAIALDADPSALQAGELVVEADGRAFTVKGQASGRPRMATFNAEIRDAASLKDTRSLGLSLRAEGKTVASSRFDLTSTAVRDALYAKAWKDASDRARNPRGCALPPPIMVSPAK